MRFERSRGLSRLSLLALVAGAGLLWAGCPDKKPKYPTCGSDKDCQEGEYCVDQQCVQCGQDAHCPDGQACKGGACVAAAPACRGDDDCPDGQVCKDGSCEACVTDGECGPGGTCRAGVCDRPAKCAIDEDCADDEDCIDGRCQKPWMDSRADAMSCQLETVYFGFDEAGVPEDQRDSIDRSAACLKSEGDRRVYLEGHTDPRGTEEYNIALSERRARAVADFLARLGIDPARFHVIPKGQVEATGTNESGWAKDRRVELEWR